MKTVLFLLKNTLNKLSFTKVKSKTHISAPMIHRTLNIWMQLQVPCHAMCRMIQAIIHPHRVLYVSHTPHTIFWILNQWPYFFCCWFFFLHFVHGKVFNSFVRTMLSRSFHYVVYAWYRRRHLHFPTVFPQHRRLRCRFRQNKQLNDAVTEVLSSMLLRVTSHFVVL